MNPIDQIPPYSPEAEAGVLGCILLNPAQAVDACLDALGETSEAFYDVRHQVLYPVLVRMHVAGELIDTISLWNVLAREDQLTQAGGLEYISRLPDTVPSAANLPYYLGIVREKLTLRKLVALCAHASRASLSSQPSPAQLLAELDNGVQQLVRDQGERVRIAWEPKQCLGELNTDLERRFQLHQAGKRSGLATGFWELDRLTDGLQLGELTVIGARPSIGKTAFGLNLLSRMALLDGAGCIFVTLEMSPAALGRRLLSSVASVPMDSIRRGTFTADELAAKNRFELRAVKAPWWVIDGVSGLGISQLRSSVRRLVREHPVKAVIIDYLQRIKPTLKQDMRTYEVAEISGALKALATETNTAVIALARVNRESEKRSGTGEDNETSETRRPRLAELSDSGMIEYDADLIGLLNRQRAGPESEKAELCTAKQRDGCTGGFELVFNGTYCRFENPPIHPCARHAAPAPDDRPPALVNRAQAASLQPDVSRN